MLLVEAFSLLSLGRAALRVLEWPWVPRIGRGYSPAHLLDFLDCLAYGRVEARKSSLAASTRPTDVQALLILVVLAPPEPHMFENHGCS